MFYEALGARKPAAMRLALMDMERASRAIFTETGK